MNKKILIVDDEIYIRALLEQALEDFQDVGVKLLSTGEGQAAWALIQAEQPDLIILDVMLPGLSGFEICQRTKDKPELANTHIIMLTAKGQERDRLRSIEVGANEYITKPFDPDHLIARTAAILDVDIVDI